MLERDLQTNVLIIGGGICGLLCAYMLAQEGVDCALVEAGRICSRTSGNTTAKITFQHSLIYHKLIEMFGLEKAAMYLDANCDFETKAAVFSPSRTMLRPQLAKNIAASAIHLLTPTTPRCSHMCCALKWNPQERSWDCPCHGSRFTEKGHVAETPATSDLPSPDKKRKK